jgi:hypothetical protein
MIAFQRAAPSSILIHGWLVRGFLRFQPCFKLALSHCQCCKFYPKLPKFAKICSKTKLWNTTKSQDFSVFWKWKFLSIEEALEHVSTVRIFNPRIFHMLFLLSKIGLCMWISAYPLVEIDDFRKVPHLVWAWDFVDMYLTHLQIRIWDIKVSYKILRLEVPKLVLILYYLSCFQ